MDSLPPDPYHALGVAKDATAAAIKTQYRKLVLKCHPDKVDDSQKAEAADKFHKIQTAWEIIGNEVRRQRYDKQCQLEELRRETMAARESAGRGGVDIRTAAYRMPTESAAQGDFYARGPDRYARGSPPYDTNFEPQYEERRPSYAAQEDYFDQKARPSPRKYDEYERSSKRSPPKDERPKSKPSSRDAKENERSSRKEKSRRTERDVRRDRDRKNAYVSVETPESDSEDAYEKARKREYEEAKYARAQFEAQMRASDEARAYIDARANKTSQNTQDAFAYIHRTNSSNPRTRPDTRETEERRPSPVRMASSKDKVESLKRAEARPSSAPRRGSRDAKAGRYESRSGSDRERDEYAQEPRERNSRRSGYRHVSKPNLDKSTSAPPAEPRPSYERQRSQSLQDDHYDQAPPQVKRSETMPSSPTAAPTRDSRGRKEGSRLRPEDAYATPPPEAEPKPSKYSYGQVYADDTEYATPEGYRTEYREPSNSRRMHHSPEPMKERSRERQRSASKKTTAAQAPPLPRTTSTSYHYPTMSRENSYSSRPAPSREDSGHLFAEIRPTASPRNSGHTFTPPPEKVSTSRPYSSGDVKYQTGYRTKADRPSSHRQPSSRQRQEVF